MTQRTQEGPGDTCLAQVDGTDTHDRAPEASPSGAADLGRLLLRRARRTLRDRTPIPREVTPIAGRVAIEDGPSAGIFYQLGSTPRHGRATVSGEGEFRYVPTRFAVRRRAEGGPAEDSFTVTALRPDGTTATLGVTAPIVSPGLPTTVATSINVVVTASVPLGSAPRDMVVSPDRRRIYAICSGDVFLSVIDVACRHTHATVPLDGVAVALAVDPTGARVYAALRDGNCVEVIDTVAHEIVDSLWIEAPTHLAVSADGSRILVATAAGTIEAIDTTTICTVAALDDAGVCRGLILSPDGDRAYTLTEVDGSTVVRIVDAPLTDPSVATDIVLAAPAFRFALSPDGTRIVVSDTPDDTIVVVDTTSLTITSTITTPAHHCGVTIAADGRSALAVDSFDGSITVVDIDSATVGSGAADVGATPRLVTIGGDGDEVYVTDVDSVSVLTRTVTGAIVGVDRSGHDSVFELIREPEAGGIILCDDGTFAYTADGQFVGDDRFAVRVRDRYTDRAPVDVDVVVTGSGRR